MQTKRDSFRIKANELEHVTEREGMCVDCGSTDFAIPHLAHSNSFGCECKRIHIHMFRRVQHHHCHRL